jgi:NB-ARC domain/Tetratricopeptide repeat
MGRDEFDVSRAFAQDLARLHQLAGKPSYATLERASGGLLKRATVSDILNGNRVRAPDWRFVAAFVGACRKVAEQTGLDPDTLGTLEEWKRRWDEATEAAVIGAAAPVTVTGGAIGSAAVERLGMAAAAGAELPAIWGGVPLRMSDFFGREVQLEDVRRALVTENRTGAVAIQGLFGIGKTKLAAEYAYRYASEYDLVWWIRCDEIESAHAAMADLESRLGLANAPRKPREARYVDVFEMLRLGKEYPRWLMIFDNASDPAAIEPLIPPMNGHVLITSRNNRWTASAFVLELDVFTREESVEFLRGRMRGLGEADAHQLAEAVGDLPLALEHAVESRMSAEEYLGRLRDDPVSLLSAQPSDYPATISGAWVAIIEELSATADYALDLLHCLSFFESGSISRELLEKGRLLQDVSIHHLLRNPMQCQRAIGMLGRVGLLRVQSATGTLQVHPVTQHIIRGMVEKSQADDADRRRHDVHLLLAADDPLNPQDPVGWQRYEELRQDVAQPGVTRCRAEPVRRMLINLVGYLSASGDPRAAVNLADRALGQWARDDGAADPGAWFGYLEMQEAKVDALLSAGACDAAHNVREEALAVMRSDPARWFKEIVALDKVTGACLRKQGNFSRALVADLAARDSHVAVFGQDHPQTFSAASNLILDYALDGAYGRATQEAENAYNDCLAFYADAGQLPVLFQRNLLARCRLLAGRYAEAWTMMTEVHAGYVRMTERGFLGEDHPLLLAHQIDFVVAGLDIGATTGDPADLAAGMSDVRVRCWRALDVDHPQTLAAAVTLGRILRAVPGRISEAVAVVADAQSRYEATLPDHPYTYACAVFLASIRRQAGSLVRAVAELETAVARLRDLLGEQHPYTLAATVGLMNALADAGELETALIRGREAQAGLADALGEAHPYTLACAANMVTVLSALGRDSEAALLSSETLGLYRATLGTEHPHVGLFTAGKRIDLDFSPLPL